MLNRISKFTPKKLHNYLTTSLLRRSYITNLRDKHSQVIGRALIYHKTTPFAPFFIDDYTHTNNWEILQQVKILNHLGFSVDVLDRNIPSNFTPKDHYDLFIGLGLDGSGKNYTTLAKQIPSAIKILYAATSNPNIRNDKLNNRYQSFSQRNNHKLPPYRFIKDINVNKTMSLTDHIFCVGNNITQDDFRTYHKPTHRIYLSTSPKLTPAFPLWHKKRTHNFLFFAGNGNILKGLDLLFEAFSKTPHLNLYVCTNLETSFKNHYQTLLSSSQNIHIENFITIGNKRFQELTSFCGFIILPTCSEGCATSVTTCMRRGLIPITTPESGIDLDNFGITINNVHVDHIRKLLIKSSQISRSDFTRRSIESLQASRQFTQESFQQSFTKAIFSVIEQNEKLQTKTLIPNLFSRVIGH